MIRAERIIGYIAGERKPQSVIVMKPSSSIFPFLRLVAYTKILDIGKTTPKYHAAKHIKTIVCSEISTSIPLNWNLIIFWKIFYF